MLAALGGGTGALLGSCPGGGGQAAGGTALAVQGGAVLTLSTPTVLVGPEGGWSERELASVPEDRRISLGPNVLRAETAAMAAGVMLAALRAGLVLPARVAGASAVVEDYGGGEQHPG